MRRPRGPGGRFLTAEEIAAQKQAEEAGIDPNTPNPDGVPRSGRTGSILPPQLHHLMQSEPSAPYAPPQSISLAMYNPDGNLSPSPPLESNGLPDNNAGASAPPRLIPLRMPQGSNGAVAEPNREHGHSIIRFGSPS